MMSQMGRDREDLAATRTPATMPRCTVLFVCTGNICRSPMAEVAFRSICDATRRRDGGVLSDVVVVASAGTANWHVGSDMDPRARSALDAAGFSGSGTPAAQVSVDLLNQADAAVALDRGHLADLRALAPPSVELSLLLEWDGAARDLEVADPFYGSVKQFDACLERIVGGCEVLAVALAARLD